MVGGIDKIRALMMCLNIEAAQEKLNNLQSQNKFPKKVKELILACESTKASYPYRNWKLDLGGVPISAPRFVGTWGAEIMVRKFFP